MAKPFSLSHAAGGCVGRKYLFIGLNVDAVSQCQVGVRWKEGEVPKGQNVVRRHQRHHNHDGTDSDLFYCDVFEVLTSIRRIVRCTQACAPCLLTRVSRTFVGFVGNQYKKICHTTYFAWVSRSMMCVDSWRRYHRHELAWAAVLWMNRKHTRSLIFVQFLRIWYQGKGMSVSPSPVRSRADVIG